MPLSWNHNSKITLLEDDLSSNDPVKNSAKKAIQLKEELILYHYSLLLRCIVGIKGEETDSECAYLTPLAYHYPSSK